MEQITQKGKRILILWIDKIKKVWASENRYQIFFVLGLVGMGLIFCSGMPTSKPKKTEDTTIKAPPCYQESNHEYILQTEQRLEGIISQISGVGECSVMLTLKEGSEKVYASENKTSYDSSSDADISQVLRTRNTDSSEKKLVLVEDEQGVSRPVVEKTIEPQINGVIVVCQGGKSAKVCQQITEAVTTVLGIRSTQVCVSAKDRSK